MVQRYEQTRKLQWYKRGAAYDFTDESEAFLLIGLLTDFREIGRASGRERV